MPSGGAGLHLAFVEPHLRRFGGIRRMVEFANRLVDRGHRVTFLLPDAAELSCGWMPCAADVRPLSEGYREPWDVVVFNHEPQWIELDRFTRARRRVFYALHYGAAYRKEGSWEALHAPVDVQLANSNWTADCIADDLGVRPIVQLGGVNRSVFHPHAGPKRWPILCSGERRRPWKGTETIDEAGELLGLPVEGYAAWNLSQPALGRAYAAASVFVVGSWFEGFCQPGLEALACGTPLVTTANGGCAEYAVDEETALVVPPRDAEAMADAIRRVLRDDALARRLVVNGLELVDRDFDWERRTDELAEVLDGVAAGTTSAPPPPRPAPPEDPELSVVVLAWDNLLYTQRFTQTVRQHTDVPYELIIVDNGSAEPAAEYARRAADVAVLNDTNLGFAVGMNQGLDAARGHWVAFCNNDTLLPEGWATLLLETARKFPDAGIVVPALTAAKNAVTVREEPGDTVEVLPPFSAPPAAVIYLMRADVARALGKWGTEYEVASGEDVDLAFKVWVNDLDIVYDSRVLVDHVGKGSASRLDDWQGLWARNRQQFLDKWQGGEEVPRLDSCPAERYERNRAIARATAGWMERYFTTRDRADALAAARGRRPDGAAGEKELGALTAGSDESVIIAGEARRRALAAKEWRAELTGGVPGPATLVSDGDGRVYVVEDGRRRRVSAGLLVPALERALGPVRPVNDAELAGWAEGVPVEVLEAPSAPPFVVVGGERRSLRGLPLPHAVEDSILTSLPKGGTLDVSRGRPAPRPPRPRPSVAGRVRRSLARRGPVGTAKRGARVVLRQAKRQLAR